MPTRPARQSESKASACVLPDVPTGTNAPLIARYLSIRGQSDAIAARLTPEDTTAQSMPACSPTKWHLAHTTWFFETFVLERFLTDFRPADPRFRVLFNSYYNAVGEQGAKAERGLMTRPSLDAVRSYRARTDELVVRVLTERGRDAVVGELIELGLQHEQQHQELMLMDIKHLFSRSPLRPVYAEPDGFETGKPGDLRWVAFEGGVREMGFESRAGFAYDCEGPRHTVYVNGFEIADRLVTNGEYLAFVQDNGYDRSELWLDAGWAWVRSRGVRAPLYWREDAGRLLEFTLRGDQPLDLDRPVCHVSFFEADAFARWRGARLATEAEWEVAAVESGATVSGNFLESGSLHPDAPHERSRGESGPLRQLFGDAWEWTRSDYGPYPGYRPPEGALGEYNGKFMCGQYVLRGGCCVSPAGHIRATYRNYYAPSDRWMFSGIRLARGIV
jgi:ergothioneine biosynthesis protein EgtB